MKNIKSIILVALAISIEIFSCQQIPQTGFIKDTSNGIYTIYKNIKPEDAIKVMNGEIFHHNQIPLGEAFEVINRNIQGLVVKDDKVSVGCGLKVSDKKGNVLLNMADIFEGAGIFNKDSVEFLRCTVNTGAPMKPMEFYDIEITYWDKFGDGELKNKLEIEIIDEP